MKRTSGRLPGTATPTLAKLTRTSGIRRLSRQSSGESGPSNQPRQSIKQVANLQKKRRKQLKEAIDLKVTANLQSVKADLMTTKVNFATIQVENLGTEVKLAKSKTEMDVKLQNFKIYDKQKAFTLYEMIAECTGDQVLDVNIEIYDMLTEKEKEMGMPDIKVKINMGHTGLFQTQLFSGSLAHPSVSRTIQNKCQGCDLVGRSVVQQSRAGCNIQIGEKFHSCLLSEFSPLAGGPSTLLAGSHSSYRPHCSVQV